VRLLISAKSDHPLLVRIGQSYYEELLGFGVRIFEYQRGINHAKAALLDDLWLMVGSANFDVRSLRLNFELNVSSATPMRAAELEATLRQDFECDSRGSRSKNFNGAHSGSVSRKRPASVGASGVSFLLIPHRLPQFKKRAGGRLRGEEES
jgi:phosphatidylserine/phosphatidylglycerophosphate/cardiolipin synthase-like enzyme